jgi:hypothetical protein
VTFGTNNVKFLLFTLLVFDDWRNGVPIAWVITSCQMEEDLVSWSDHFDAWTLHAQPKWRLSCFIDAL